jgi:ABC-type sugar transport system ATPase subunit
LAEVLRSLREAGRSVIYISHRLGEVFDLCDSVTVFRNGEQVATAPVASFSRDRLIETMLGRSVGDMYPPKGKAAAGKIALAANGLRVPGAVFDFSVSVPTGAIVAIAGQVGSGAATVTRAMAGLVREAEGAVEVHGRRLRLGSVRRAVSRDVLFVTDDRAGEGIFRGLTAQDNLVAMRLAAHRRAGILSWADLRRLAARLAGQVRLPPGRLRAQAGDLSGGNQQKLVFARAVERPRPCILLMNEPTRGIDVGARAEIYRLMRRFCEQGYAIVMTSSDLEEIAAMADIVYTMYRGRGVARYEGTAIEGPIILRDIAHPDTHSLHAA